MRSPPWRHLLPEFERIVKPPIDKIVSDHPSSEQRDPCGGASSSGGICGGISGGLEAFFDQPVF